MKRIIGILMGLMLSCAAFAQPYPEKVYVHLDRTYFAAGEIIWLKGYVEDVLPEEMPGGRYLLRAYTRWQLNWPEERLFHAPIDIYAGQDLAAVTGGGQVVASTAPVVPLAVSWDTPAVINKNGVSYSTVSLFVDGFKTSWDMARSYGGIVLVQLRVEAGRKSLLQQGNTIVATPLGWQQPKAFPDPAKERSRSLAIPDRRNTVYWNPSVRLRAGEPVDIPLVTEDRADGPYLLRIEGRTAEGRWISQEYTLR